MNTLEQDITAIRTTLRVLSVAMIAVLEALQRAHPLRDSMIEAMSSAMDLLQEDSKWTTEE